MTINHPLRRHRRFIHLDFHTSPFIPDVAHDFDAGEFVSTLRRAHVDAVTVFAKCHHGMCYYPTRTGTQHPALQAQNGRDLLGEQIEALHRAGIFCPIYTTVVWEEDAAQRFPQWRQLRKDGTFAGTNLATDNSGPHPGAWKWLNFLDADYQDYIEAHVREILDRYGADVDGFFFDILMMHKSADWSGAGLAFRQQHGLMGDDAETHARFETAAQAAFCARFSSLVQGARPTATLFYNSGHHLFADATQGSRARVPFSTHFEVESLPSGFWGYFHFPRMARLVMSWERDGAPLPWLAMTGRFQKQWGDFGGHKPQPALEFECFRAQALDGANSVGDQLPPRGVLDPAAYDLIGAVYAQCERAEPFYQASQPVPQIGIVYPGYPGRDENAADKSIEGAVMMCEEAHYECAVVDDGCDFSAYELIVLPDAVVITPALRQKLADFFASGGKLLLSHRSGFDAQGAWALDEVPLQFQGEAELWPTFWRVRPAFDAPLSRCERVFYERGLNVESDEWEILAERVPPYFQRTDVRFCSHFQTPPAREAGPYPAAVAGEHWIYFADPVCREVRQSGNLAARDGWRAAMKRLIGPAPYGDGLPTTVLSVPRRRGDDLLLTLLHYIPVRKSLDIDVIEERMSFAGLRLKLPAGVEMVRDWGTGETLPRDDAGAFLLPPVMGRLLLEAPGALAPR